MRFASTVKRVAAASLLSAWPAVGSWALPGCGLDLQGSLALSDGGAGLPDATNFGSGSASGSGSGAGSGSGSGAGSGSGSGAISGSGSSSPGGEAGTSTGSTCDFNGTWGTKININVTWSPESPAQVFIMPGSGQVRQWVKSTRVQHGTSTVDTAVVCGITLPDFSSQGFIGTGETFGIRFPDSLFDDGGIPSFQVNGTLGDTSPSATFNATAGAALLGLTMPNPTMAAWPAAVTTTDPDGDNNPGVTVDVASGPLPNDAGVYSSVPVDLYGDLANQLFVVIRQVTQLAGAASSCDHLSGSVTIPRLGAKYAIDSHVIGCNLVGGGQCSPAQAAFVDATEPVFSPTSSTSFTSVRMADRATCADVRAMFP